MKRSHWIPIGVFSLLLIFVLVLQACNGKSPAAPGQISNYTPSNCDGVLGNNAIETTNPGPPDLVFVFVVPGSNTTLTKLSVYTVASAAVMYEAGIYSNNSGVPGGLLDETGPQTISGPATQWNTASLKSNINLASGVTYWLAFQATNYQYGPSGSGSLFGYQPVSAYGALPANFSGTTQVSPTYAFSIYGTTCP